MAKRVYQVAQTLGVKGVDVVHYLREQGFDVKSHMSPVSPEMQEAIDRRFAPAPAPAAEAPAAKPAAKKAVKKAVKKAASAPPAGGEAEAVAPAAKPAVKRVAKKAVKPVPAPQPEAPTPAAKAPAPAAAKPAPAEAPAPPPAPAPAPRPAGERKGVQVVKRAEQEAAAARAAEAKAAQPAPEPAPEPEEKPRVIRYAPGMEPGAPDRDELLRNRGARPSGEFSAPGPRRPGAPPRLGGGPRPGGRPLGGPPPAPAPDAGPGRGRKRPKKKGERDDVEIRKSVRQAMASMEGRAGRKLRRRGTGGAPALTGEERTAVAADRLRILPLSTLSELANAMQVPQNEVIATCLRNGLMVTINQRLEREDIELIANEYEFEVEFISEFSEIGEPEATPIAPEDLEPRAPVVTVMGHVDHGKTKLLDYIRKAKVAEGEAGAITQHIGAYSVQLPQGRITFLDTPGHAAFTAMRARGTLVTDLVILVVAADDGVMPQTVEAIDHAKAGRVPVVVAINKIDLPAANPDRVKQELLKHGVTVEEFGGQTVAVPISAKFGQGVDKLLEIVLLQADLLELRGAPRLPIKGTVVEARKDPGRGVLFTVLVQQGTLRVGTPFSVGLHYGSVRAMINEWGERIEEAGPAMPVEILGASDVPEAGDIFNEAESEVKAREISVKRQQLRREQEIRYQRRMTLDDLYGQINKGEVQELNLVLKGDVAGSVEAMADNFQKLSTGEVKVNIIHKSVGTVTESDVLLAAASSAIVIGFNVRPQVSVRELAKREQVEIRTYDIIYEAVEEIKQAMSGLLRPEIRETVTGTAEVRQVFRVPKIGAVAGCYVTDGTIERSATIRVLRDGVVLGARRLASLKRFKEDVGKVESGYECGLSLVDFQDIKEGDVLEAFVTEEIARRL
ncbi:translation initiation factor IF-2 [bacterium]|nr:translation initiation factor IF-2 [bacterium]